MSLKIVYKIMRSLAHAERPTGSFAGLNFTEVVLSSPHMPLKPKTKRVTLADMAKTLDLTPRAVSKALNGEDSTVRVSEKTRERVLALAKRLNYRPNRMAKTLRTGKSGMVGVLAFQAFGHLFQLKLYLARQFAEQHGFHPNIYVVPDASEESCNRAVDIMIDSKVDALIVFNDLGKAHLDRLVAAGIPAVVVGAAAPLHVPTYFADFKRGVSLLAKHLIAQGSSSMTLLYEDTSDHQTSSKFVQDAIEGIQEAVKAVGREEREVHFRTQAQHVSYEGFMVQQAPNVHGLHAGGYLGMREIIRSGRVPDALICNGDATAHGALLACAECGLRVPHEMMVVGVGDDPASSAGLLPLTTIRQPLEDLCRLAFDDLKRMAVSGDRPANRRVVLPYELIVRESTRRL